MLATLLTIVASLFQLPELYCFCGFSFFPGNSLQLSVALYDLYGQLTQPAVANPHQHAAVTHVWVNDTSAVGQESVEVRLGRANEDLSIRVPYSHLIS